MPVKSQSLTSQLSAPRFKLRKELTVWRKNPEHTAICRQIMAQIMKKRPSTALSLLQTLNTQMQGKIGWRRSFNLMQKQLEAIYRLVHPKTPPTLKLHQLA